VTIPRQNRQRGRWALALLLTGFFHAAILLGVSRQHLLDPSAVAADEPEVVQVVFAPQMEPKPDAPNVFSELPPDRKDEAAEDPDFLSNVDSRARDNIPGGEDRLPRMEGRSEAPHVQIDPGAASPAPSEHPQTLPTEREATAADPSLDPRKATEETPEGLQFQPQESSPNDTGSDLFQEPMASHQENAALPGGISLNTTAWDYAPWLQSFSRELQSHWEAPLGNQLGLISGWTLLRLEISPSGELTQWEVIDEEGLEAFRNASIDAVKATAPFRPLPDGFPEPTLILQLKMIYPERPRIRESFRPSYK